MSVWISGTCVRDPRTDESILSERRDAENALVA